ncbi:unnamed protein product [Diabrotica balteata]|uniref:VWFA domain-containing protein n=1 Tax=Diabrotica balteata TaxID=107213 RepID=A0A9P0GXK7_DIABA|nr:unnamed protein product [Diabrotica balteata]
MQHWETYRQLSDTPSSSMEEEIKLFLRKISRLEDVAQFISSYYQESIVAALMDRLQKISFAIKNESSLNAGGKFEWVDSVLIKCLQDGSWLLVDNVNLCSSAVLDRLNALLEPNGVLTVSERGVDANGQMVEIKPHKDFRLFLTMDPRNGEISRAMRNRGIEIYLLNEGELQRSHDIDRSSLIQLEGLSSFHAQMLIKLHNFISELIIGERPNVNELIQVSTLAAQQLKYGVDSKETFTSTILEIYYKTRSPCEFTCTNFETVISEEITKLLNTESGTVPACFDSNATLKTREISLNSSIEKIKQQSVLLFDYLENVVKTCADVDVKLGHLLFCFYSTTSLEDISVRHSYLQAKIKSIQHLTPPLQNLLLNITNKLLYICQRSSTALSLPIDHNWIPEISTSKDTFESNTLMLPLFFSVDTLLENTNLSNISGNRIEFDGKKLNFIKPKKGSKLTLVEYSRYLQHGLIEDRFGDVVIQNFTNLTKAYNDFLITVVNMTENINNHDIIDLIYMLFWKSKLVELLHFNYSVDVDQKQLQKVFAELPVHYRWFYKFSVQAVSKITNLPVLESLEDILKQINSKLDKQFSIMHKLGKNYQKSSNRPPPYTSKEHYDIIYKFNEISERYNSSRKGNDVLNIFNSFNGNKGLRSSLVEFKAGLDYGFNDFDKKIEQINEISIKINSHNLEPCTKFELQLVPLLDHLMHLQIRHNISTTRDMPLTKNVLIPTELCGTLVLYHRTKDPRLSYEMYRHYYQYLMLSPSAQPSKFLGEDEEKEINEFGPKITFLLSNLLINAKGVEDLGRITLGNFRHLMKQHDVLNLTLWGNLYQLSDKDYSFMWCEKQNITKVYTKFLQELALSLKITTENETNDLVQNILKKLQDVHSSDAHPELTGLLDKIKYSFLKFQQLENILELDEFILTISCLYQSVSYLKAKFNSKLSSIDPLAKKTLKRNYCLEAIKMFDVLRLCYVSLNQIYSDKKETVHDYCKEIEVLQTKLQSKHRELSKYVAYRPDDVLYSNVSEVINYAFSTLLADDYIVEVNDTNRQQIIRERLNKVPSYENLIHELSQYRSSFPDIIEPLLSNISEYLYGFKLYLSVLKMQDEKQKQSNAMVSTNDLISLVRFPSINQNSEYDIIKTNKSVKFFLDDTEESHAQEQENFRLLQCSIVESVNTSISNSLPCEILRKHDFFQFSKLLDTFIGAYNKQQEQMEAKKQEEESLYKIKTNRNDKSEEEQIQEDLNTLFPNYHTIDFADFQKDANIDDTPLENKIEAKYEEVISYNDLTDITQLHVDLLTCMTRNEWLNPTKTKKLVPDYILPLLEKFKTFSKILEKVMDSVDYRMDEDLIASLNVLLAVKKRYGNTDDIFQITSSQKTNDFYKDSNVEEVKSCYHVLEDLKNKINELLAEWPDQPTLNTILTVIDRIYKFEITSPISRYLTGFEILLTKCHEWEEVAHSGVSLSQHTQNLTNQIVTWRKIELSVWKDLLSKVHDRLNEPLPKWWLHLYNVMHQFIDERKFGEKELVETLQTFITKSNMAEFQGRLNLLYAFHCHATYLEHTEETESFINILWNVYSYFRQFNDVVSKKIKDLKSPIEKKLKDYVKIVRWKDINYWAIKDTVEKSHKNIHKFMREYQSALEQPVSPCIHNIDPESSSQNVGIWDKPKNGKSPDFYSHYLTSEIDNYLSDQQEIQHSIESATGSAKRSLDKATKVRELSRQIILSTTYPALIQDLDGFVTEVIETSSHLQKLEVDTTLTKEKQKSQAKNILQRKHRALADLFKSLTKMGLSFKTGIVDSKVKDPTAEFLIKPIDLESQFRNENYGYKEERILSFWESSEKYYVRSLMRFDVLETALQNPSKELGMQNIERLKGFSQDMLTSIQHQKIKLVEASRVYYYIRHYARQLKQFCNAKEYLPCNVIDSITVLLSKINSTMSQYQICLNTCPVENSFNSETVEILILETNLENRIVYKNDKYWSKATALISNIQSSCRKLISQLFKAKAVVPTTDFQLLRDQYVPITNLSELSNNLSSVQEEILSLKTIFANTKLINNLLVLADEVQQITTNLKNPVVTITSVEGEISAKCEQQIKKLSKKILNTVTDLHKQYEAIPKPKDDSDQTEESILEDHLTKYLVDNLSKDISQLDMQVILEEINQVASYIMGASLENMDKRKTLAGQVYHVLDQAILLQRYFFTQQVAAYRVSCKMASVLLNIFIELASKGFCIPPEFSDEFDKEGISKPSDGLGLGEGQGERDVSDKIESEDQLDDAQPAGKEKDNEEDKDCKEEEKGIEMSEDFDSKLQDKEKKDDDDSNSESGDSDADEQMGETEKGAEQQNSETFGDDKEEGDGEEQEEGPEQKEEKGEKGEKEGEEQLGAKEGKTANDEEDQKEGKEEKEKNKKEINEMEEPEYDDEQIDPHHGQQQELPEPEPMDLPEDMQLDEGEANDEGNDDKQDENPFDIDTMKADDKPDDKNDEAADENKDDESKRDDEKDFSSDDEDVERGDKNDGEEGADGEDDENKDDDAVKETEKADKEDDANSENGDEYALDQTQSHQENVEAMEIDDADAADKAQANKSENQQSNQPIDELQQEDRPDKEGVGQSQMEETSSGHTAQTSAPQEIKTAKDNRDKEEQKRKQKPGESDSKRSLGDVDQPVRKKLKTVEAKNDSKQDKEDKGDEDADMYQHIQDAEKTETQVLDVATQEQAENQKKETHHEEEKDEEPTESSKDLPEEEETDVIDVDTAESEVAEKLGETKDQKTKKQQHPQGDVLEEVQEIEIEGELVQTSTVSRSTESTHHTQYSTIAETTASRLSVEEINSLRLDVERQLSGWNEPPSTVEADQAWQKISSVTSSLAQDLSEQLRLVLEPTQASRLRGDFRTGRRINMRKVIPYIASQFRKDKIWLRRTKPSKREYQIVLAIDDSSSMADNHSKELAFESVALISKALSLLESGQLSVLSFGENVEVIHKLADQFTDKSGVKLLQKFKFDQNKTCVAKLVDFSTEMFNQSQLQSTALNAKLLVIVSDGRGVFSEGETFVKQAVRRGKLSNIFMVFVIIDNPENKNSVLDIRMPVFKDGKLHEIHNYMDVFPFSFYIILRDINSLPSVLSDALRQWFEIVSNLDK